MALLIMKMALLIAPNVRCLSMSVLSALQNFSSDILEALHAGRTKKHQEANLQLEESTADKRPG